MIGKTLANRYEIIEKIGEGGMALVYKAKCHLLNRFVAIKVLRDEFTNDEDFIRKFRRESQAAASLSHPNILNIYDVGVEEIEGKMIHYIVMEYINGLTLKEVIKEKNKLTIDETINYSVQIAEALQHAHRNHIVHRDIKPHNIMITEDNRVKVTDFGIARAITSSTVTTTSNVLGSVHYFSPEQARGGYTDEKSDIYSLGIVMYEMITGKVPYDGESPISVALMHIQSEITPPREHDSTISLNLESIILKCVQKRQSDRYNNIADLIHDIKNIKSNDNKVSNTKEIDFATRLIPAIDLEEDDIMVSKAEKKKNTKTSKTNNKGKKTNGGGFVVFLGILLAFLLVTSLFFGYAKLKEFMANDEIIVPSLIGMQEDEAKDKIESMNLVFNVTDRVKNSEFSAGQVIYQSVEENSKVKSGYPINVTISEGEDLVNVPSLVNKTLSEAEILLQEAGLRIGQTDPGFSETIPTGTIISQDPNALIGVAPGSRINIVVSQGPEVRTVIMPNVRNISINQAKANLEALGLVVEITPQSSENVAVDLVTWQSYEQGTELETGTSVELYISSGPETIEPIPGNENEPGENSDAEVPITLTITPLADRDETEIKIIRIQDNITELVHNRLYKASEGSKVITLYGKIGAKLEVFYDGIYQDSLIIQ
jgi:serine/threonine-protein kinase